MPRTRDYLIVVPAFGRDYKSEKEVKAAWNNGADFLIYDLSHPSDGPCCNAHDVSKSTRVLAYYSDRTQRVVLRGKR